MKTTNQKNKEKMPKNSPFYEVKKKDKTESLIWAVETNDLQEVKNLLAQGVDINVDYFKGNNLLLPAISCNDYDTELLQLLINHGLDVNHQNKCEKKTPLHVAAERNEDESHLKLVEIFLQNGAVVNARDEEGNTPLWYLVRKGNMKIVKLFLDFKADVNLKNNFGETLLFSAISWRNKNTEVIQLLIDLGLTVNWSRYSGRTLFDEAEYDQNNQKSMDDGRRALIGFPRETYVNSALIKLKIIKCLLKNGVNISKPDRKLNPIHSKNPYFELAIERNFTSAHEKSEIKSIFNFILDHTYFNSIHSIGILTIKKLPECTWKVILQFTAKLQSLEIPIDQLLLNTISKSKKYNNYYKECENELLQAKSTKLKNCWVTYYNLLIDNKKQLKNYAGNNDLITDFKTIDCVIKFPIYGPIINVRMNDGIERRKLFDKSLVVLSNCSPIFTPNHIITRGILDCNLKKKDLRKLCQ